MSDLYATGNQELLLKYTSLPQDGAILTEYIWVGLKGDIRSKTRSHKGTVSSVEDLPLWNFDGSSTGQAPVGKNGHGNSEVLLKPISTFKDPFRGGDNLLVLCECFYEGKSISPRTKAAETMEKAKDHEPWFGIEQEYTLFSMSSNWPLGWPRNGYPGPQGPYYCGVGSRVCFGREISECHYRACIYAGVKIAGTNSEVMPGQWEYQVGICEGIESGDHLVMSRYILSRISEEFGVDVSFDPKPIPGDWNGAGAHVNFSTKSMRSDGGYDVILEAVNKLEKNHSAHIACYGEGNERRLTGKYETSSIMTFSWGVGDRSSSVRIPRVTIEQKKGYLEDRRPSSNMDPYVVCSMLVATVCDIHVEP